MGKDEWLIAFAPITLLSAGGFLAVNFLQNRESTGDLDYFLEPQWADDMDIKQPLHDAMRRTAKLLGFAGGWVNEEMAFFVKQGSRQRLFEEAERQQIILWEGTNLRVLALPLEWALERKLRRIHNNMQTSKRESDIDDALALLRYLRAKNEGPLGRKYIQALNICSTEMPPDNATMDVITRAYQTKYNEDPFH